MATDAERLRRIRDLFEAALPLDAEKRRSFLETECPDPSLRADVEAVLGASDGDAREGLGLEGLSELVPSPSQFRAGDVLGDYTIVERIGAGGIGEVYLARDSKLEKDVAIKVLAREFSGDAERFARFRTEARTLASLNHSNIVAIHHAGEFEGSWFLVMEFVDGETLADRIREGRMPLAEVLRIAAAIADGLEAAHEHEKRIVHRDLKPANIMIAATGGVKVLDFGLSQPHWPTGGPGAVVSRSRSTVPDPERIEGTPPYMSPEQLRGEAPHRASDIWAFGCVLYEMLAGRAAFRGSGPDIVAEILKGEPNWSLLSPETPAGIRRLLRRCLSKDRKTRLHDIGDAKLEIEEARAALEGGVPFEVAPVPVPVVEPSGGEWKTRLVFAMVLLPIVLVAILAILERAPKNDPPSYQQISFRKGTVWRARFSSDGRTVVYSATWDGAPIETFSTRGDGGSTRSEFSDADLLAISSHDELAILRNPSFLWWFVSNGTLSTTPLGSPAPRDILDSVQEADWGPDGKRLAVTRSVGGKNRLEYPVGTVLYETSGYLSSPRVSPAGDRVAFLDHPIQSDNRGFVAVVDTAKNKKVISGEWAAVEGLAWPPAGDEVWFSANKAGESSGIYAATLRGKQRIVARAPGNWVLQDVSRDGRALIAANPITVTMRGMGPDEVERDLSWLGFAGLVDLAADGSAFVFTHWGEGSGPNYTTYLRRMDGSPAIRLGEGSGLSLSPDGKWVLTLHLTDRKLLLLPTGPGEARTLDLRGFEDFGFRATWFPYGQRILFAAREPGHAMRSYAAAIDGSTPPVPVTPEGVTASVVSVDGRFVVGFDDSGVAALYPSEGGEPQSIPGLDPYDKIIGWSRDPNVLHIARYDGAALQAVRLDVATGYRETFKTIEVSDTAGITWTPDMFLTRDGNSFIYQATHTLSTLYKVEGLR